MSTIILYVDEARRTLTAEGAGGVFVENDKNVNTVRFALLSGFADIVLDEHTAVRVMYIRPGETEVRAKTLTFHEENGINVFYDWTLQAADLEEKGTLMVSLCILRTDSEVEEWHTTPYQIRVLGSIHTDDSDEGDETITPTVAQRVAVLETMIQRVASGAPIVVSSTSAMTDTNQIYVLSTNGRWYYHNGSAWVAGGEYGGVAAGSITTDKLANKSVTTAKIADGAITAGKLASGAVPTDTTLTQAGIPADAKVVGDELNDVAKGDYDLGSWIPDRYIQTNGNTNAYTGWKATNFIQVPPIDSLYIISTASSNGSYNCFYNASKQKTGDSFSFRSGENSITIPSDAAYFRLSMPNSVNVQVQTVIGNKVEKNTADILKLTEDANKLITVVQTNATVGKYIYYDGTVYNDNSFMISDPVYIRSGSKIHLYGRGYSQNICMIAQTHADNNWHFPVVNSDGSTAKWYTFNVTRNGYYTFSGNKDTPFQLIITPSEQYPDNKISLSMFQKFGVIGDSYASGVIYTSYGASVQKYECSWGQIMARKFGTQCTNYSSGGLSTRTWLTSSSGLTKLLNHEPEDIYYCALGINDYGQLGEDYLGSLEDITSHQSMAEYADSFYGNYGRIIENIKAHAPHALIVMFTCANTSAEIARRYSNAIIELANHYQTPYIVQAEDPFFAASIYTEMFGGHPTSIGYAGMANAFERLLQDCVYLNRDYFKSAYRYSD